MAKSYRFDDSSLTYLWSKIKEKFASIDSVKDATVEYQSDSRTVKVLGTTSSTEDPTREYATIDELDEHTLDSAIHVTSSDKTEWNTHKSNSDIHVTAVEKSDWNLHKNNTNRHCTQIEKEKWNNHTSDLDIHVSSTEKSEWDDHVTDATAHVTASDKTKWNSSAPLNAPTFTGVAKVSSNTAYETAQIRNITISTSDPSGGSNGDIWIKYSE